MTDPDDQVTDPETRQTEDDGTDTTIEFVVVDFAELRYRPESNGVGWRSTTGDPSHGSGFNDVIEDMFLPRVLQAVDPDEFAAGTVLARVAFHDPDNPADSTLEWHVSRR